MKRIITFKKVFRQWPLLFILVAGLLIPNAVIAQQPDSVRHFGIKHNPYFLKAVAPASLILAGIITNGNGEESFKNEFKEERDEHFAHFHTHLDDYLQFAPIGLTYGLEACGMHAKTDQTNRAVILVKSELMMMGIVTTLKNTIPDLRPDGSAQNSFPSGHTAQAFAAATFLTEEYGHTYKWTPFVAYSMATSVGLMRVANNRHYISDVLAGAGIGILATEVAYLTHHYHWGKKHLKLPA